MKHNNQTKTKDKVSIKWAIFGYCIVLVVMILVVIWGVRLIFVDNTYQQVRSLIAERSTDELVEAIKKGKNVKKLALSIATNSDNNVIIMDGGGDIKFQANSEYNNYLPTPAELVNYRKQALAQKNKKYSKEVEYRGNNDSKNRVLVYTEIIDVGDYLEGIGQVKSGKGAIVMTCRIMPMTPTLKTINYELLIVSIVMLIFAFLLAIMVSRHISKPLIDMNNKSRRLAKGDYSVKFNDKGYKEVGELADTLNYATEELGKADRMRRDLIANVSHDLRTPLTMIRGYVEMMKDMPNERTEENMDVIIRETNYLTSLVKDMLDISKLDANVTRFEMSVFDMNEVLHEVVDRYNAMYRQQGYRFEFAGLDSPFMVRSDRVMITNVLYNLINNAINHIGEDGLVNITCEYVDDDRLKVHVIDHGEGIEQSKLETIWDRYYKAERNLKRENCGSGLGLSIVKTVLTKLDARYGVNSKVGEGSDFFFDIKRYVPLEETKVVDEQDNIDS